MRPDHRAAAWSLFAAAAVAWGGAIWIALPRTTMPLTAQDMLWGLSFLALAAVGAIVVSQRSTDVFGWLLILGPLLAGIGVLGSDYVGRVDEGAAWPAVAWVGLGGNVAFTLAMGLLALAMFRFPDGSTLGPWWRRIELATVVATFAGVLGAVTSPSISEQLMLPNPLFGDRMAAGATVLESFSELIPLGGLLSIASLFVRYRRGGPRVRAQLRWVLYPAAVGVTFLLVTLAFDVVTGWEAGETSGIVATVLFTVGLPAGILAAITRDQLYDIDRLISRTVAYAIVTAVLLVIYAAVAIVPVVVFDLAGDVPVAIATLAAAAAFQPVRGRVQGRVDRRFHRSRYDAQRVVERFGEELRDQVDLQSVSAAACRAAVQTVHPVHAALWLPGPVTRREW
jgi:hypothetical protein